MKSSLFLFSILLYLLNSVELSDYTNEELNACKTAENIKYLNQTEKDVLFYMNLVRINPNKFSKKILEPYISKNPNYSKKYYKSLLKDLNKGISSQPLLPSKELFNFSKKHAKTTGKKGKIGHRSVKGKSFTYRTKNLIKKYNLVGENIHYGSNNAIEIVIDLLIDDGIKDVGHRLNILNETYVFSSVSIQHHKTHKYNCVINFAGRKI